MNINTDRQHYQQLIDNYRRDNALTFRKFTEAINRHLPQKFGRSANHWYAVYRGSYVPDYYLMVYLAGHADDWVRDFAEELVKAMENEA